MNTSFAVLFMFHVIATVQVRSRAICIVYLDRSKLSELRCVHVDCYHDIFQQWSAEPKGLVVPSEFPRHANKASKQKSLVALAIDARETPASVQQ